MAEWQLPKLYMAVRFRSPANPERITPAHPIAQGVDSAGITPAPPIARGVGSERITPNYPISSGVSLDEHKN